MSDETWRPVVGYEGLYEVSDHGNVRGLKRGKALKPALSNRYPYVNLSKDGHQRAVRVHTLVASVFIGARLDDCEINHKDCDRTNNHVSNLEYITHAENMEHAVISGRCGKLSVDEVRSIRGMGQEDIATAIIAEKFGVTACAIYNVLTLKTFGSICNADGSPAASKKFVRNRKLSTDDVEVIIREHLKLRDYRAYNYVSQLAKRFGVSTDLIHKAIRRWKKSKPWMS